tara:strand:- start:14087 stop:15490 length:1404 start_codon:yes stop_codon:yes gene_type:complete
MNKINSKTREVLKSIPAVDHIILDCYKNNNITFHYSIIKNLVKQEIKNIKTDIINGVLKENIKENLYNRIDRQVKKYYDNSLKKVINGTGIVLHTGLGRAPISKKILRDTFKNIYPYNNLEFEINNNARGDRNNHISYLINSILGSESSIIVNNNAAAVLLALNTFSNNKEVIISRGELVEIGGSFRIPDVIKKANCKMFEIGTTNKTHLEDFKNAINDNTGLIMIAHTSNYKVVGFTESVEIKEIVKLAKRKKIPVFLDLGSGAIIDYAEYGLPAEKLVQDYIKLGVDIISFSGDKLLGGPQSGIICGKKKMIKKIFSNSMYRALRCDKIIIGLLESTLRTYRFDNQIESSNLTFSLLTRDRKKINSLGKKILNDLDNKIIKKYNIQLVESKVQAGSGSLPIEDIESMAIKINSNSINSSKISLRFRQSIIPTIGYIKGKSFFIDLKAVPQDQINDLILSIKNCLI